MVSRFLKLAAPLTVLAAGITACSAEAPTPVGVQTVQLAVIANADHGGKSFATAMTQEVTSSPPYQGDIDGTGSALLTVNHGQREVCWELSVTDVTLPATAAHIHKAAVDIRGPIVVGLSAPDAAGHASGCVSDRDADLLRDILTNPADYYVNVHTTDYPAGAVRGQLGH
jgi:hypothetical protein